MRVASGVALFVAAMGFLVVLTYHDATRAAGAVEWATDAAANAAAKSSEQATTDLMLNIWSKLVFACAAGAVVPLALWRMCTAEQGVSWWSAAYGAVLQAGQWTANIGICAALVLVTLHSVTDGRAWFSWPTLVAVVVGVALGAFCFIQAWRHGSPRPRVDRGILASDPNIPPPHGPVEEWPCRADSHWSADS